MKKNIIWAFLLNLIIIFITIILLPFFLLPFTSLSFEFIRTVIGIVPLILYLAAGFKFYLQKNPLKDFLSVAVIGVTGLLILLLYISKSPINSPNNNELYLYDYYLFLSGVGYFELIFLKLFNIIWGKSIYLLVIQCFMPSFLIWIGMELKRLIKQNEGDTK